MRLGSSDRRLRWFASMVLSQARAKRRLRVLVGCNVPPSGYAEEGPKGGISISERPRQQRTVEVIDPSYRRRSAARRYTRNDAPPPGRSSTHAATTVELGEALHQGQTDPYPRRMTGRGTGGLAERFEDRLSELGRDPRSRRPRPSAAGLRPSGPLAPTPRLRAACAGGRS